MSKKIFGILLLILFIFTGCSEKKQNDIYKSILQKDKIIVGMSFDSKPFGFQDSDGQVKGLEADLAREIAKEILGDENKVEFKNITTQNRINAVTSGDVDIVISTMTITPERKKIIDFSDPYFVAGQVICVKKDSKIDSIYDLMNKKVIVELGTTGEKNIRHFVPNALIQSYYNNSDAINAFKSGDGDAITTDDALLQSFVAENNDYKLLPKRLTKEPYGIAFRKSKHSNSLKKNINNVISEIKLNGTLNNMKSKWEIIY